MRIEPLDGPDGYLRWKESVLLRLHSLDVAHVLSDDPPAPVPALPTGGVASPATAAVTAKKWARDDAVCRGHILAALSDRLLPDYARHGTGRAVWQAVARSYDLGAATPSVSWKTFLDFRFDEDDDAPLLEQIAHAEALAAAAASDQPPAAASGSTVVRMLCQKLPEDVGFRAMVGSIPGRETMDAVWAVARAKEESRVLRDLQRRRQRCKRNKRVRSTGGTAEKHVHMAKNRMT